MRFVSFEEVIPTFRGRRVAIVGSAPSCLDHAPGFIDGHEVVVRVNNHRCGPAQGRRTDVHYSFYGTSVRTTAAELAAQGVTLVMNKCPDGKPIESEWHERAGKQAGIDFSYIFRHRADFWFCDTFIPSAEHFLRGFELLERHIPTTGFAAILDVLACAPESVYLTGFDFFTSGLHNVDERWTQRHPEDPIGHRPELEAAWLAQNLDRQPILIDKKLRHLLKGRAAA